MAVCVGGAFEVCDVLVFNIIIYNSTFFSKENYSGAVKVWDAGMSRFKGYSLGEFSPACVRSVCRTKVGEEVFEHMHDMGRGRGAMGIWGGGGGQWEYGRGRGAMGIWGGGGGQWV